MPFVIVAVILAWILLRASPSGPRHPRADGHLQEQAHLVHDLPLRHDLRHVLRPRRRFGLLINNLYGTKAFGDAGIDPVKYAFLGALIGSAARIIAGPIADRVGGGRMTVVATVGISLASLYTCFQLSPTSADQFPQFLYGMLAIFFFAGVGNASTFKQMPMIFERRQAGGVIGWTSAIAAYGPFIFGVMLAYISPLLFFSMGVVFALIAGGISWWFYARPGAEKPC